jgi:CHAT domain-containing protein
MLNNNKSIAILGSTGSVGKQSVEIAQFHKLNVDLLVLSACNTNRGESKIQPGDDIAALSNAFFVAGAKNIIATQWPASDSTFPQIMTLLLENWLQMLMLKLQKMV